MRFPGFTAELAIEHRNTTQFWGPRPARSALAEAAPQLVIGTQPPYCPWPCFISHDRCYCPFG
jgi:hypothetical protein